MSHHNRRAFNEEFAVPAAESGSAFVPLIVPGLADRCLVEACAALLLRGASVLTEATYCQAFGAWRRNGEPPISSA